MIPCLHFGLRPASGRFTIEPKLASWVESGYKSPESPGPRQRGRRRDGLSRRRRGRFRSTAPYPAATNSRGVSKPRARRDNGLTFTDAAIKEIARIALQRGTGARGLRSVVEEVLEGVLFDVEAGARYVVTEKTVKSGEPLKQSMSQTRAPLSWHVLRRLAAKNPSC